MENNRTGDRFFWLGVILLALGFVSCIYAAFVTIATMVFLGYLLVFAGAIHFFHSFSLGKWNLTSSLFGFIYCLAGILIVMNPTAGSIALTIFIALCFAAAGIVRIGAAIYYRRYSGWGYTLTGGLISLLIGCLLYASLPWSSFWLVGTFIAIELIVCGMGWIQFGLALKRMPQDNV